MNFKAKIILLSIEVLYLVFLISGHFLHKYGIQSYQTGVLGVFQHSIRLVLLLIVFRLFPDNSNSSKSKERLKKEKNVFVGLLIIAILLILTLSFF